MGLALMPEKRKPARKPAAVQEEMTSTRLITADNEKLLKLSALRGEKSIAVTFRHVFGKLLDNALIQATRQTLEETERGV